MTVRVRIDKGGRIVLPRRVPEQLRLAAGDELESESMDDRITLRPVRGTAQLRKKRGVWVFRCGEPLAATKVEETVERVWHKREVRIRGRDR